MSEEVKRVKREKVVEEEVVVFEVELSAEFFDNMVKAKKQVADKRGYDVPYGEYIEEAMSDLVQMVGELQDKVIEASQIIMKQDEALGKAEVVKPQDEEDDDDEERPLFPGEVPPEFYAHLEENEKEDPMFG